MWALGKNLPNVEIDLKGYFNRVVWLLCFAFRWRYFEDERINVATHAILHLIGPSWPNRNAWQGFAEDDWLNP